MNGMWLLESMLALLAAVGLIVACALFIAWLRGDFVQPKGGSRTMTTHQFSEGWLPDVGGVPEARAHDAGDPMRDQARYEALVRLEERNLLGAAVSDSPVETPVPAAPTPPATPEPARAAEDAARERARAEALARIEARAAAEGRMQAAAGNEASVTQVQAAAMRAEIERRAAKAQGKGRVRPGVRTIAEHDFSKPLYDDIPRGNQLVDPLDQLPGYR